MRSKPSWLGSAESLSDIRHIPIRIYVRTDKDFAPLPNSFEIFVQHAAHDFEVPEPLGPIDYNGFLVEFRQFDWVNEANQAFWVKRASPKIAVRNMQTNAMLSVMSHDVLSAVLNYREPTCEAWIDFIIVLRNEQRADHLNTDEDTARGWYDAFSTPHKVEVEKAYLLFFRGRHEPLYKHLSTLMPVTVKD